MSDTLFKWFTENLLKANPEKSHLLINSAREIQIKEWSSPTFEKFVKKLGVSKLITS